MPSDFLYGARSLRRTPAFGLAVVLSLALGIGATTAMFTILDAVALTPLPYTEPNKLLWMTQILQASSTDEVTITPDFLDWRRQNHTFTDLAAYNYQTRNLTGLEEPVEVHTARASASLLPLLGVHPALGRNFLSTEDYKGRDQVALLSDDLWQRRFGSAPGVVGRPITLDGRQYTIVGVLPRGFLFPGPNLVDLITPLAKDETAELQRGDSVSIVFNVLGRLKPGVTSAQARADLEVIQARLPPMPFHPRITIRMLPLREHLFGNVRAMGLMLMAAAAFLLLIAGANVSNLLLARLLGRDRELAIRAALGGSRGRLVRQLLLENMLIGLLACAAGLLLAYWLRNPLLALSPYRLPGFESLPFNFRVFAFSAAVSVLATLLFGLAPAFRATDVRLAPAIRGGPDSLKLLSLITAGELAVVITLSTGAGLMLESFWNMRYANLGFQPERLIAATLRISGRTPGLAFMDQLLERARALPGVESAAITDAGELPPGTWHATNVFAIEGRGPSPDGHRPIARYQAVSAGYFGLLGIPLLRGRLLEDADGETAPAVAVVNRALAERYFRKQDPIGRRVREGGNENQWRSIVGVVGDVKTSGLAATPEPAMYYPYRQTKGMASVGLVLRSGLAHGTIAAELRKAVAAIDPNQPVATIESMDARLTRSVAKPRFTAVLLAVFAALAVALGVVGVHGVMGCRVRRQFRELAVRQALGASPRKVVRHVLGQGLAIVVPGSCLGLAGGLALSRILASWLYEVHATDTVLLATTSVALLIPAALAACWVPAVRASRADPLAILRQE